MKKVSQKMFKHLEDTNLGYFSHMKGALKTSRQCFISCLTAFIHGLIPSLFETTASDTVKEIYLRQKSEK